jgi:hypothetical protein
MLPGMISESCPPCPGIRIAFSKETDVVFARSITMRLKPNSVTEFIQTLQNEIDPLLRKEKGFRGHIAFVVPDGT